MMNFSDALIALKKGSRIQREGWNNKEQWIAIVFVGTSITKVQPYIGIYVPQLSFWQPGWLASQADLLADDWKIVE